MSENWSAEELRASVEAYLDMQRKIRSGEKVVKKVYYVALSKQFGRTEKSYEYRMQNISYVLSILGREWVPGLRPAKNVGANVASEIESILASIENRAASPDVSFESQVQNALAKGMQSKPAGKKNPKASTGEITQYERDPKVKAWVLLEAAGICECCGKPAPFITVDGNPFLEVHHLRRLADGGSDTIENAIAACPDCHRELHYGRDAKARVEQIYTKTSRLVPE